MRRRGNKSNKVPNVKLRPAAPRQPSMSRPVEEESCWAQETQLGSDDTMLLDRCPRPFKGLVICATGIPDKQTIFTQAVELGATPSPAFTDRVTHLIADSHGGPKYGCAVERKLPIVKPAWITESYQIWLKGDDVDAHKTLSDHRLPTFSGIVVCLSGITDILRRTEISKLVSTHGGTYVAKLERPVKVTHLLCSGDEETDKMRYAQKFNDKREANIQLVWEEWFWDSLHYGGRFDEVTYQVRRPRPEPKPLPDTATPPPPSSDFSSQHELMPSSPANPPVKPQHLANDNDEMEEVPAVVKVVPAVTRQLWSSLLKQRGYQVLDGGVVISPSKENQKKGHKIPESPHRPKIPAGASVISSFRRANSFAPVNRDDTGSLRAIPFQRAATSTGVFTTNAEAGPSTSLQPNPKAVPSPQIFAGMTFRILGEARTLIVRQAIEEQGGLISTDEDEETTFTIVRLVSGSKLYQQEDDEIVKAKYRTECWLEHSLFEERICAPDEQIFFRPISIPLPINGAEEIVMCLSGFEESCKHSLSRLLRALGITMTSHLNLRNTHLLCQTEAGPKYEKALEWGITVISLPWLKAFVETGIIPEANLSQERTSQDRRIPSSTSPSPMKTPSLQTSNTSRQSLSPVKIDHDATKALQESITSLLGKRPSPDVEDPAMDSTGVGRAKSSRPGKRVRPQRSKLKEGSEPRRTEPPRVQTRSATDAALRVDKATLNAFGTYTEESCLREIAPPESQQEGIRVTYEDPAQRDEKMRLMNILKGKTSGERKSSRRSQRVPGF